VYRAKGECVSRADFAPASCISSFQRYYDEARSTGRTSYSFGFFDAHPAIIFAWIYERHSPFAAVHSCREPRYAVLELFVLELHYACRCAKNAMTRFHYLVIETAFTFVQW